MCVCQMGQNCMQGLDKPNPSPDHKGVTKTRCAFTGCQCIYLLIAFWKIKQTKLYHQDHFLAIFSSFGVSYCWMKDRRGSCELQRGNLGHIQVTLLNINLFMITRGHLLANCSDYMLLQFRAGIFTPNNKCTVSKHLIVSLIYSEIHKCMLYCKGTPIINLHNNRMV